MTGRYAVQLRPSLGSGPRCACWKQGRGGCSPVEFERGGLGGIPSEVGAPAGDQRPGVDGILLRHDRRRVLGEGAQQVVDLRTLQEVDVVGSGQQTGSGAAGTDRREHRSHPWGAHDEVELLVLAEPEVGLGQGEHPVEDDSPGPVQSGAQPAGEGDPTLGCLRLAYERVGCAVELESDQVDDLGRVVAPGRVAELVAR